jgi:hypothetical protein
VSGAGSFQRLAGASALAGAALMLASIGLSVAAAGAGLTSARELYYSVLGGGSGRGYLLHLSMVADMLGYYLLLAPVALFLQRWLRPQAPSLALLCTVAALAYILAGALGAAILSAALPPLVDSYVHATAQQRPVLETVYRTLVDVVYGGIWNTLEMIPFGTWLIGIGMLLREHEPRLGPVLVACGVAGLLDAAGFAVGLERAAIVILYPLLALFPIVVGWLGLILLRGRVRPA